MNSSEPLNYLLPRQSQSKLNNSSTDCCSVHNRQVAYRGRNCSYIRVGNYFLHDQILLMEVMYLARSTIRLE